MGWESEMEKRQGEERREEDNTSTHLQVSTVHTENAEKNHTENKIRKRREETHITTAKLMTRTSTKCVNHNVFTVKALKFKN